MAQPKTRPAIPEDRRSRLLAKRTLVEADLYDPPLTNFGRNAVERFFTPQEIGDLLQLTQSLAA